MGSDLGGIVPGGIRPGWAPVRVGSGLGGIRCGWDQFWTASGLGGIRSGWAQAWAGLGLIGYWRLGIITYEAPGKHYCCSTSMRSSAVTAIVPVFPAVPYRHYRRTTTVPVCASIAGSILRRT